MPAMQTLYSFVALNRDDAVGAAWWSDRKRDPKRTCAVSVCSEL